MVNIEIGKSRVLHTRRRKREPGLRRRREMPNGTRFNTVERVVSHQEVLVCSDEGVKKWNPAKLRRSISNAGRGRLSEEQVDAVASGVAQRVLPEASKRRGKRLETTMVPRAAITQAVFDGLRQVDHDVSAVRYALGRPRLLRNIQAVIDYFKDSE